MVERPPTAAGSDGDPLEALVAAVLECADPERAGLLARLERDDPDGARRVRSRLAALGELGFALDAPRADGWLPERFGRFTRLERVGAGGMGEVHLARDEANGELAAVKLLRVEHARLDAARRRFRREVEALLRLEHPGIVRVLDAGQERGLPWLALEWVGGASLEEVLDRLRGRPPESLAAGDLHDAVRAIAGERPFPEAPCAGAFPGATHVEVVTQLAARVARALAFAHQEGVLHRDVKPSNVLVTPGGRVLLADFGLALPPGVERMTRTGSWLGSLPYAAPEQLAGDGRALGRRADVYSLGATLYELLALRTPFLGGPESRVRRRIATGELEPLRRLNPAVPAGLARVCTAMLDLDPRRRPADAVEVAEDLERARGGRAVRARRAPAWLRLTRSARRRPARTLAIAATALALGAAVGIAVRERGLATRLTQLADAERARGLIEEASAFWPPARERIAPMSDWLTRASAVLERERQHRHALEMLNRRALPYTEADRERDLAPTRAGLATLARELVGLAAFVSGGGRAAPPAPLSPEGVRALDESTRALVAAPANELIAALRARVGHVRALMEREPVRWRPDLPQLAAFELDLERAERVLAERRTWRFAAALDTWRHGALERLLRDLEELAALAPRVERELEATLRLQSLSEGGGAQAWERACADVARSPRYAGLALEPVFGLLPLGEDPRSGLWEFLLAASGEAPPRDASEPAGVRVGPETGVVLVLLPGGRFRMGQEGDDPRFASARPAHEVELAPFFASKFELTAAQFERLGGLAPGDAPSAEGRLPVPLGWERARALLLDHGLELPTEAQWEYLARAGEAGEPALAGRANVLDRARLAAVQAEGGHEDQRPAEFDDGWAGLAPVGSFAPNAFGLCDVIGNLAEWCLDSYIVRGYATLVPRVGDGLRATVLPAPQRVRRGGGFSDGPERCAPALRDADSASKARYPTGVRPVLALPRA